MLQKRTTKTTFSLLFLCSIQKTIYISSSCIDLCFARIWNSRQAYKCVLPSLRETNVNQHMTTDMYLNAYFTRNFILILNWNKMCIFLPVSRNKRSRANHPKHQWKTDGAEPRAINLTPNLCRRYFMHVYLLLKLKV